uniref:Uncharacterized protein n=1 Tax=Arundo donax TaxID=35708 RepID=A0A0A9BGM9_ARUDO
MASSAGKIAAGFLSCGT